MPTAKPDRLCAALLLLCCLLAAPPVNGEEIWKKADCGTSKAGTQSAEAGKPAEKKTDFLGENKREDLIKVLADHKKWLDAGSCDNGDAKSSESKNGGKRANFCQQDLRNLETELKGKDLQCANFEGADLRKSNLSGSHLDGADMRYSDLSNTTIIGATVRDTHMRDVNLRGAKIKDTHFTVVDLNSRLELADSFKKWGYRQEEREIKAAFKRDEVGRMDGVEKLANQLVLELVDYGVQPLLPIVIMVKLALAFWAAYFFLLYNDRSAGILYLIPPVEPLPDSLPERHVIRGGVLILVWWSGYLSLLGFLTIGWKENPLAAWQGRIRRFNSRLVPTGWLRVLTGLQSAICGALWVLALLFYFGRPLE
jgi:Pentapeptide repeats (8 copies)